MAKNKILAWICEQKSNAFLWTPIFLAFGIALYFTLFNEPNLWVLVTSLICGITAITQFKRLPILGLFGFFIFGFGYAGIYTHIKTVPELKHDTHGIEISGTIINSERIGEKIRMTMHTENFGNVRISTTTELNPKIGDTVSGDGGLFKPKPMDMPHSFDFARNLYFNNISATGYINDIKIMYTADPAAYTIREYINNTANSYLTDTLVLGYKNTLPAHHMEIWRTTGMAHIWSISGYHITLVGGWLFIIFYMIFRSIPYIVRRIPARVPATICSWVGLCGYVLLSGANIATLRAFIMATLIMVAFILGRQALSLRMASFAFVILALINPHYIMTAGFQLSFAAIFGIIWLWQNAKPNLPQNKLLKYIYTAVLTAFVASIFTAPFTIMNFGTFPIYGVLGNLIFLPLFSFILMPLVFIGTIGALFGIHTPLNFAHIIYNKLFDIAKQIMTLPLSTLEFKHIPNIVMIMFIIALSCLIFIRNIDTYKKLITRHMNFVLFSVFTLCGIIIWFATPKPVFYIAHDHKLIGAVIDGKLKFNKSHDSGNYFAFDTWKRSNSESKNTENERLTKESGVYTISYNFGKIVYLPNFVSISKNISELCQDNDVKYIVSYFDINSENCGNKIMHGGGIIYKSGHITFTPFNRWWHSRHE